MFSRQRSSQTTMVRAIYGTFALLTHDCTAHAAPATSEASSLEGSTSTRQKLPRLSVRHCCKRPRLCNDNGDNRLANCYVKFLHDDRFLDSPGTWLILSGEVVKTMGPGARRIRSSSDITPFPAFRRRREIRHHCEERQDLSHHEGTCMHSSAKNEQIRSRHVPS